MATTVVLIHFTPTLATMITNAPIAFTQNSSASLASNITVVWSHVGVYQCTTIGFSEVSICLLVSFSTGTKPYRKALFVSIFFRKILNLSATPSVLSSNLMMTVTSYFGISMESAKREVKISVTFIHKTFFCVSNLQNVEFLMLLGNPFRS